MENIDEDFCESLLKAIEKARASCPSFDERVQVHAALENHYFKGRHPMTMNNDEVMWIAKKIGKDMQRLFGDNDE